MKCCGKCFGDKGLEKEIIPSLTTEVGTCSYCGTTDQLLIIPNELGEYFRLLISIYEPDEDAGETLVELLKKDWALFGHASMDNAHAKELLSEILNDGEIVRKKFRPSEDSVGERLAEWKALREELMYVNRFFPQKSLDEERLEELLSGLIFNDSETPDSWFRARIQPPDVIFTADNMGAPPKRLSVDGRANPAGIPYLYLASTYETACAEVRPHPGQSICVASVTITPVKLVDLRNPRKLISPFLLSAERKDVALLRGDIEFLEEIGKQLTAPVLPTSASIDYIPSQYICELIKKSGYGGVIYESSITGGINLALFNPEESNVGDLNLYLVARVTVDVQEKL